MDSLHWQHLLVKLSATATRDSHYSTCLGHLGQYHGQGKYIQCDIAGVIMRDIALNIANVNSAYPDNVEHVCKRITYFPNFLFAVHFSRVSSYQPSKIFIDISDLFSKIQNFDEN
jgi:hypothetical protein